MLENLTTLKCQSTENWKAVNEAAASIIVKLRHIEHIRGPSVRTIEKT